jgi:formylglycine-generating enzyme
VARGSTLVLGTLGALAIAGGTGLVIALAAGQRASPARCPAGLVALGPRCCAPGQTLELGACAGSPESCPAAMRAVSSPVQGCAPHADRIAFARSELRLEPRDWETGSITEPRTQIVAAFALDRNEVTALRWTACVRAGACTRLANPEPGLPVRNVTPQEAEGYCTHAGGRLPTAAEFLLAAAGRDGARRFPWGATGLVCRRASFGLIDGPCAEGASGPELAGARPDGASPEGALDLAGNVAEWTREPGGSHRARGGSYRSRAASELKSWASEPAPQGGRAPHIGFRCAYHVE